MSDLTLPNAKNERDQLAPRTDVLDKVGALATLPDDVHATADQVATFYETTREVIRQTVLRNKDEFDTDGYRVLTRAEVSDELSLTPDELGMPRTAPSMSLFPRRAVLRVGMLLRDSPVARRVRDYLLDSERPVIDGNSITRLELIQIAMNAEQERLALEAENKELAPKAEAFESFLDATGKFGVGAVAKMLGTSQNKLYRDLRNLGVLIPKGAMRNTPYQKYMHHFEVKAHEYERSNGEMGCSYTTYVQPSGIDFIRRKLGLPSIDPIPGVDGGVKA